MFIPATLTKIAAVLCVCMKQHAASSSPFSFCNITTFSDGSSRCSSHQARQKLHPRTVTTSRFTSELAETLCHSDLSPWFHRAFIVLSQLLLTENKPQKQTRMCFPPNLEHTQYFSTLLPSLSVSISSLCLVRVSFMLQRWSLIMLSWSS